MEGSNPFVKSKHSGVFDRVLHVRFIHVPALLQTAVSFHIPYGVNEKSSLLLCPGFRNINLRTPGSFGTLFPRGSDELSR